MLLLLLLLLLLLQRLHLPEKLQRGQAEKEVTATAATAAA